MTEETTDGGLASSKAAKGEFNDLGAFKYEEQLLGMQTHFQKIMSPCEVDLFATLEKVGPDYRDVIGKHDVTVGELLKPLFIRINRNGQINLYFQTSEAETVAVDITSAEDVVPTAIEGLTGYLSLEHGLDFKQTVHDNQRLIGSRLPIVRKLNEALEAGMAITSIEAKQKAEIRREQWYEDQEGGMF